MHIVIDNLELLWVFRHANDGDPDFFPSPAR
jgi:hypothetical protein